MKIFSETDGVKTEITDIVGSLNMVSDVEQVSETLTFTVAYNEPDTDLYPINPVGVGSVIFVEDDDGIEQYRGMVWEFENSGRNETRYDCYDYMMYLKQNKEVFQFNEQTVTEAITLILDHYSVEYESIAEMNSIVDKWYYSKTPLAIIKELIDFERSNTGKRFFLRQSEGKVVISEEEAESFTLNVKLYDDDQDTYSVDDLIANSSYSESITDLRNSVKVIYQNDLEKLNVAEIKTAETVQDETLVQKYGLLQEVLKIEGEDKTKANHMATTLLDDLARVAVSSGITLLGDLNARSGKSVEITQDFIGLSGKYLIKQASHSIVGGIHTMRLILRQLK